MKRHRECLLGILFDLIEFGTTREDRTLSVLPLFRDERSYIAHMALYAGGSVYILPTFQPKEALRIIEDKRITTLFMVSSMHNAIINLPQSILHRYNFDPIRILISAGSPLFANTKEAPHFYFKTARLLLHHRQKERYDYKRRGQYLSNG